MTNLSQSSILHFRKGEIRGGGGQKRKEEEEYEEEGKEGESETA